MNRPLGGASLTQTAMPTGQRHPHRSRSCSRRAAWLCVLAGTFGACESAPPGEGARADTATSAPARATGSVASAASAVSAPGADAPAPTQQRLVLAVEGMVCESCEQAIHGAVSALPGVKSCTSSHRAGRAEIEYDAAAISPEKLVSAIAALGYRVSPAPADGSADERNAGD